MALSGVGSVQGEICARPATDVATLALFRVRVDAVWRWSTWWRGNCCMPPWWAAPTPCRREDRSRLAGPRPAAVPPSCSLGTCRSSAGRPDLPPRRIPRELDLTRRTKTGKVLVYPVLGRWSPCHLAGKHPNRGSAPFDAAPKSFYTGQSVERGLLTDRKRFLFSFDNEYTRRVKAGRRTNPGRENQRRAFTPAVILFIALPEAQDNIDPG